MTPTKVASVLIFTGVMILVCFGAIPAAAQLATPGQPVAVVAAQPLGSGHTERELIVTASTFGGYDTDVSEGSALGAGVRTDAPLIGGSVSMHYGAKAERIYFLSDVSVNPTHYRSLKPITGTSALASASTSVSVTRKLKVDGSVRTDYLPLFHFSVLPTLPGAVDQAQTPSFDYLLSSLDGIDYRGNVVATYDMSSRSALHANYGKGSFRYIEQDYHLNTQSFGGGYSRGLTRYATLRLGFVDERSDYPLQPGEASRPLRYQTIDAGVDYSRPLSATRRTSMGFGTSSVRVDNGTETFYDIGGHASLSHQIRRTGNVSVTYSRGVVVVGGFSEPFFADSVALNLRGNTSRRVKFSGSASYANGDMGLGTKANAYESIQASVRVDIAVSRRLTMFSNYFYYNYLFNRSVALPQGVSRSLDRQGVRVGLQVEIPVLEERKPRVTR